MQTDFKVNLFIVGAAKCGTTFLAEYLGQHSQVNISTIKEPDFFSHNLLKGKVDYYNSKPVTDITHYKALFDHNKSYSYYAEASVSYLPYAAVAQKIYDYNPEAKIIILLRDPVARAFSHYNMDRRLGYVKDSFSNVVMQNSENQWQKQQYHQYVELGFYYQQVSTYMTLFGAEQVHCIRNTEHLEKELPGILNFLGLTQEAIHQSRANEAISFSNPLLKKLYTFSILRKVFKGILPNRFLKSLKQKPELMDEDVRVVLTDLYKEDQLNLKKLLDNEQESR